MKARIGRPLVNLETGNITHTVEVFAKGAWHCLAEKIPETGKAEIWHGTAEQAEAKAAQIGGAA